jgi:outer membrane protein OmpA-like peptidoglycan-associated protein
MLIKQPLEKIDSPSGYKPLREIINEVENSGSFNELLIPADEIFQDGTARFRQDIYPELDRIISLIDLAQPARWRIEGHMDNTGNASEIKKLSQERAKAVYDYFISKGIQTARLRVYGLADNFPIGDNNSPEGRKLNRRIMIIRETPAQISAKQEEGTSVYLEDSIAVLDTQNIKIENETDENNVTQSGETFDQFILRGDDTFEGQSANLTQVAKFLLDEIVKYLKEDPGVKWKIESYMDNQGSADFLNKLSEERAKSVNDYLITKGLPCFTVKF